MLNALNAENGSIAIACNLTLLMVFFYVPNASEQTTQSLWSKNNERVIFSHKELLKRYNIYLIKVQTLTQKDFKNQFLSEAIQNLGIASSFSDFHFFYL